MWMWIGTYKYYLLGAMILLALAGGGITWKVRRNRRLADEASLPPAVPTNGTAPVSLSEETKKSLVGEVLTAVKDANPFKAREISDAEIDRVLARYEARHGGPSIDESLIVAAR